MIDVPILAILTLNHQIIGIVWHLTFTIPTHNRQKTSIMSALTSQASARMQDHTQTQGM